MFYKILLISFLAIPSAFAEQFQAPVTQTRWHLIDSPLECSLSQDIPGYGQAGFYRANKEPLTLSFATYNQPSTKSNVSFNITQAPWQNSNEQLQLTKLATEKGQKSFIIKGLHAEQALTHLQEGQFPIIHYTSLTSHQNITVMLSTVHLNDYLPAFRTCLASMHPDTFSELQYLTIYFDLEKSELTMPARKALDRLAAYVKVDSNIKEIQISGHTDSHGRRSINIPLSRTRGEVIRDYLIKQHKLDEKLFRLTSHVAARPAASNKTQKGRAYNRRAEITMIR